MGGSLGSRFFRYTPQLNRSRDRSSVPADKHQIIVNCDLTDEQIENARRTVARGARDSEDLALLLDMLGLLPKREDDTNDVREKKELRRQELARLREAARKKMIDQQLSWLARNDY